MKSVSIIYRRSKTTRDFSPDKQKPQEIRRVVDEYYTKLVEKGKNQVDLIEKIRSQTARANRIQDRKKVFTSLSIAAINPPPPPTPALHNKSNTEKKLVRTPTLNIKRTSQNFFTLNLPDSEQDPEQSPIKLRRSLKQPSSRHARLKILLRPKCIKEVTLIMSIDFICNELNFWSEQNIQDSCVKTWKNLSSLTNVIWLVRRENTYKKLLSFSQCFNLRLDGVVQIEPNKKQSLTISYYNIEQEMKLQRNHKLLIINALRNESLLEIGEEEFRYSLPLINHPSTFIHFAQIDINDRNRLAGVKKILTKGLPEPFPIKSIIEHHIQRKGRFLASNRQESFTEKIEQNNYINPLEQIEAIKARFLKQFAQSIGLTTKLESGDSVNYLIGDMLRRNYNIAKSYYSYCQKTDERKEEPLQDRLSARYNKLEYNRNIYIWKF